MYDLVEAIGNKVFTSSKIIAEGTHNKHYAVRQIIQKYETIFEEEPELGKVTFKMEPLKSGQKEKVYILNEGQAMFLMTLLRNDGVNGIVVKFKARLANEFVRMRKYIENEQKRSEETKESNKKNRLQETDVIKELVEYAKGQGSTHSDKLYIVYTKLAKKVVGGKRNKMTINELNTLTLVESIILQTIEIDMSMNKPYKEIYQDCKGRIEQFMDIAYLTSGTTQCALQSAV